MLSTFKEVMSQQYEAAFCMLSHCINRCPDERWPEPVIELQYNQVVFHALFFADTYLGPDLASLRGQPFHVEHAAVFGDYEELEDRPQQATYEKPFAKLYLQHCRAKAAQVVPAMTEEILQKNPGFDWLKFSRAEVHVYNLRHIHHHAAQLSLRLRLENNDGAPWVGTGWRD